LRGPTGNFRLHKSFHFRHLPDDRDLIVYLPPGYEGSAWQRDPVLYLHHGQNPNEAAEELIGQGSIHPVIMVGIYNTGPQRIEEYTPARDTHAHSAGMSVDIGTDEGNHPKRFVRDTIARRKAQCGTDNPYRYHRRHN
jgi:predicted alpha/beta superfamily hydrolase